jgi:hypothetical protein
LLRIPRHVATDNTIDAMIGINKADEDASLAWSGTDFDLYDGAVAKGVTGTSVRQNERILYPPS